MTLRFASTTLACLLTSTAFATPSPLQGADLCSNAQPIEGTGLFAYDNTGANTDGLTHPGCDEIGSDVWFLWTALESGPRSIETCGLSPLDTTLAVYPNVACPPTAPIACNDDSCSLRSKVSFSAVAGTAYLVRVGSWTTSVGGPGQILISETTFDCAAPPMGPDVIVGDIPAVFNWGAVGSINAYSLAATACNVGDTPMPWEGDTSNHPVIAPNLFRLSDGRFEQIGRGWIKHGFGSATDNYCCQCQDPNNSQVVGVGCSDTYGAALNGNQGGFNSGGSMIGGIGPRYDVDPVTGIFPFPYTTQGQSGDGLYKRLQVRLSDLDPAQHPNAQFFAEVQYMAPHDAQAGNDDNNASYRPVEVTWNGSGYDLSLAGPTRPGKAAIEAWKEADPTVELHESRDPEDGRFLLGSQARPVSGGRWEYEYALYNMNSRRAGGSFRVAVDPSAVVDALDFHDIDENSGSIMSSADWPATRSGDFVEWATGSGATANALRWGSVYNFRFRADRPPVLGQATIGMHQQGFINDFAVTAVVPDTSCGSEPFCVAAPNTTGAGVELYSYGLPTLDENALTIYGPGGVPGQFGVFFYGPDTAQTPVGDGFLCVAGGLFRIPPVVQADFLGVSSITPDWSGTPFTSGPGTIAPGSTWHFQLWYRSIGGPMGTGYNFSDGLSITFCP